MNLQRESSARKREKGMENNTEYLCLELRVILQKI